MKKFAIALAGALALSALTAGGASADCPTEPAASSTKNTTGTGPVPGVLEVDAGALSVYGALLGLGYGESDVGVDTITGNVTYDGELAGAIGHGEIENGSVGTNGVHGEADGRLANPAGGPDLASGSGHLHITPGPPPTVHLSTSGNVAGEPVDCVNVVHP